MLFSVIDPTGAVPKSRVTVSVTTPEVALPAPRPHPAIATAHAIATAVTAALHVMTNPSGLLDDLEQQLLPGAELDVADPEA
jgi:hypothetical protein